jgi:hypothetical protein
MIEQNLFRGFGLNPVNHVNPVDSFAFEVAPRRHILIFEKPDLQEL